LEVDSFAAVTAKLDGLACKEIGKSGAFTLVSCQGKIVTTYNNENQEINLAARNYQAVQEMAIGLCVDIAVNERMARPG